MKHLLYLATSPLDLLRENTGLCLFFMAFFAANGVFCFFFPVASWKVAHLFDRWEYENGEPSEDGLWWQRVCGVICFVVAAFLLYWNFV